MLSIIIFFLALASIFLGNIFLNANNSQIIFFITVSSPMLLFLLSKFENKKIVIPYKETILYLLFLIFSVVSTSLAIDKGVAFQSLLVYVSGYFFFIYAYNNQKYLEKYFHWFLILISAFSSLMLLVNKIHPLAIFKEGESLFYGGYYHNEAGNVIVLGLVVSLYLILFRKKNIFFVPALFLFPFLIFSYSRSAYLALIATGGIFFIFKKNWLLLCLIGLTVGLFFITTKEVRDFLPAPVDNLLVKRLLIPDKKSLTGKRFQHFYYALLTIRDNPILGVGPGNLYLNTVKYQFDREEGTTSAHDIFLDVISENGLLAGLAFIIFFLLVFRKSHKNRYYYLFLSLTIIFLFDFSYRYTTFFLLWLTLGGITLVHGKNDPKLNPKMIFLTAFLLFVLGQWILAGKIFYDLGLIDLSVKVYPLNDEVYRGMIENDIIKGYRSKSLADLEKYDKLFKRDFDADISKGRYYEILGDDGLAIYFYQKAIDDRPLLASIYLKRLFPLEKGLFGDVKARINTTNFINQFKKDIKIPKNSDVSKIIGEFCYDYELLCR